MFRRRTFLAGLTGLTGLAASASARPYVQDGSGPSGACKIRAQTSWTSEPAMLPVREGLLDVPGGRIYYWDSGGEGEPIILLHAATGSALNWAYQQAVFIRAGYRVIAYSRLGHYRSDPIAPAAVPEPLAEIRGLLDGLGIERCHLLGTAAGGIVAAAYAISHPGRLWTLIIANSLMGVRDEAFRRENGVLMPAGFHEMPPDFRELSPSYRIANPPGRARWLELVNIANHGSVLNPPRQVGIELKSLNSLPMPTLILTGDADPYLPPARARALAAHLQNGATLTLAEAGHSAYWEQPVAFNQAVLAFLKKRRAV